MESTQNLKRRIRSVQNIGTITKAMELVAATKMRRAQEFALQSRPYAYAALEILGAVSNVKDAALPELLAGRPTERIAFFVVTSDKGLAGSFNSAVIRAFERYVRERAIDLRDPKYSFIAVGQKSKSYFERRGLRVAQSFLRAGDFTRMEDVDPISKFLVGGYLAHEFDAVVAFSTNFVTALRQEVLTREILPISLERVKESIEMLKPQAGRYSQYLDAESLESTRAVEFKIEPSPREVLEELSRELMRIRIYHMILEANASEHSARRFAMKNASDNAAELGGNLNKEYNKSRQAAITNQIIEVTSGAEAIS